MIPVSSGGGSESIDANIVTQTATRRLIYFKGHTSSKNSALICRVCMHYETVTSLFYGDHSELATRTLANLYNLVACRGNSIVSSSGVTLNIDESMSGPHHYFGYVDVSDMLTIIEDAETKLLKYVKVPSLDAKTVHYYYSRTSGNSASNRELRRPILPCHVKRLSCNWISGRTIFGNDNSPRSEFKDLVRRYGVVREKESFLFVDDDSDKNKNKKSDSALIPTIKSDDSLFHFPGVLELNYKEAKIPLIFDAYNYDLSSFKAKIVKNDEPFAFNQDAINQYRHAQHKLRVITYFFGKDYSNYYYSHSGLFLERHEFVQIITRMNNDDGGSSLSGGYVILGREVPIDKAAKGNVIISDNMSLELIALTIPFGYSLMVEPFCYHGDSHLIGYYMMAMTGNHHAMGSADTVFIKHKIDAANHDSNNEVDRNAPTSRATSNSNAIITGIDWRLLNGNSSASVAPSSSTIENDLLDPPILLTSNKMSLSELHHKNNEIQAEILKSVRDNNGKGSSLFSIAKSHVFQPVILTLNTWEKTLGVNLPSATD